MFTPLLYSLSLNLTVRKVMQKQEKRGVVMSQIQREGIFPTYYCTYSFYYLFFFFFFCFFVIFEFIFFTLEWRMIDARTSEVPLSHKTITEPKIIVQTRSEVDLLDDGCTFM